jgi:hypothetical protein
MIKRVNSTPTDLALTIAASREKYSVIVRKSYIRR